LAGYQEPRIKLSVILNVGVFEDKRRHLIKELKAPVGWFLGGPKDAGTEFVSHTTRHPAAEAAG
jgi:hypothetical protein